MTVVTYQIAGRSPFPVISSFLTYAIESQTRTDPRTAWAPKPVKVEKAA